MEHIHMFISGKLMIYILYENNFQIFHTYWYIKIYNENHDKIILEKIIARMIALDTRNKIFDQHL